MNAEQIAIFTSASGASPAGLLLMIALVIVTLTFLWTVWVAWGSYRSWTTGQADLFDMTFNIARAVLMLSIIGFFIRP